MMTPGMKRLCEAVEATEFPERFAFIQAGSRAESSHEDAFASHINPEIVEPIVRAVLMALREPGMSLRAAKDTVTGYEADAHGSVRTLHKGLCAMVDRILAEPDKA